MLVNRFVLNRVLIDRDAKIIQFPLSVAILYVADNSSVALLEQRRKVLDRDTLELPGGVVEENETPEDAARREFQEETGLIGRNFEKLLTIDLDVSASQHQTMLFRCVGLQDDCAKVECTQLRWLSFEDFSNSIRAGSITHAPTIAAAFWMATQ